MKIEIRQPTPEEIKEAESWPTWSKDPSEFPWYYDQKETCYIIEGTATVKSEEGQPVTFSTGDWVVFPKGLQCTWQIHQPLVKKYKFN